MNKVIKKGFSILVSLIFFSMLFFDSGFYSSWNMFTTIEANAACSANAFVEFAIGEIGNNYSKYTHALGSIEGSYQYSWCAAFTSYCAKQMGLTEIKQAAGCDNQYYNSGGTKHRVEDNRSYTPQSGDLVYYHWNDSDSDHEFTHVEIVEWFDSDANIIHTIAGNSGTGSTTTRKVCRRERYYDNQVKCFITPDFDAPEPPTAPHPRISKSLFSEDEYVEVTWNATPNTTHYWLHTYKDGEDFENTDMYDNLSYSRTYPAGNYTLYIAAYNSAGESHDYVEFTVYNTKPESPHPQIDRKFYSANEEINVTWNETNITTHYWLHTYKDGEDFENTDMYNNLSYSRTYPAGNYTLYIASYNNYGYNADCVEFTVYDSKPQWAKVSVDKTSYSVGETVVFTLSSDTGHAYTIGIDDDKGNRLITYDTEVNQNSPIQSHKQILDKSGNYSCYITTYNNYGLADSDRIYFTIEPNGDCNDDGEFSVADVILLQKWLLTEEKSIKNWKAADFCEDDQLDVFDLCLMKRKLIAKT